MDKIATKRMLRGSAVQLPADWVWQAGTPLPSDLTYPIVAKTPGGGSTIGVYICDDEKQLVVALDECTKWESTVLLEQKIVGEEITVAILEDQVLPVVAIRPVEGFFDFDAKYTKGQTEYLVPAPISEASSNSAQEQALVAWRTLRLAGIARADFIVDAEGIPWFLEINTIPGMTETSLSPMAAGALGISFEALVERCLLNSQLSVPTE
jgi:D-alanine-D-alanine ligase